jgi:hypothetical protein
MPTFDGGHYFLTVLVPVKTDPISAGSVLTSPVHALRKKLAMLPPAQQTPACGDGQSPFARNTRNHFARFVVIDDVAYNGRVAQNSLWLALRNALGKTKITLVVAQPQDHLTCPFLLFSADIDAESGADSERDSYLALLWKTMERDLREIFVHCEGFDGVNDEVSFAKYIASCQLETTMPFNDYYIDPLYLPTWPADKNLIPAGAGAIVFLLGLAVFCFLSGLGGFVVMLLGAGVLAGGLWMAYASILAAGNKPFPTAPDSNLPAVLKGLHLQREFTRFVIKNQLLAVDPASAQQFHDAFGAFIATNEPDNLVRPTQPPGIIGI